MRKVIGYVRVSTSGQVGEDKYGLDSQKEEINEYCKAHDMEIMKWVEDAGVSGAKERENLESAIRDDINIAKGINAIVVAKNDRVARDIKIFYYYKMCLQRKGADLISVKEDFGEFGVFAEVLEAMTVCFAKMEREQINARMSAGRKAKAAKGGFGGGRIPLGYDCVNGKLIVNEEEAEVVRKIFEMHDRGCGFAEICNTLTKEGYRTKTGKVFIPGTVYKVIQKRLLYQGYYQYSDGKMVRGDHEAILDE